jgi:prepilin-type N-terminal cleavage/methylation domain-containing protein
MSRPNRSRTPGVRHQARRRAGFSLIEMLVVVGLIAFLTAAIVAVIPRVANASKVAATKATIKKVDEMLNDRINGFRRWIQKQDQMAGTGTPSYVSLQTLQLTGGNLTQAKILAIKQLFRSNFAQAYTELPISIQTANPRGASHLPQTDSAECLYLILTKGPLFDTEPPSAADLKSLEIADTDGDGIPEIIDAWGQPLRYYRWPTRLVRPATAVTGLTTSGASGSTVGPIDELVPQGSTFMLVAPSPLTLAMIGAAPRPSLPVWLKNINYNVGDRVVSGTTTPDTSFSVIYQCVTAGTSGGAPPAGFSPPQNVGTSIPDNTVTWQVLLDPLSVDPDDPYSMVSNPTLSLITETPSSSSPLPPLTPNTWSVPLIVSCGLDGQLGLYEPYDTANFGSLAQPQADTTDPTGFNRSAMYDNITNHQQ